MPPSEKEALNLVSDALEKERTTRLANSPAYRHLASLTRKECEYLAAVAIQALKDAGYEFEKISR